MPLHNTFFKMRIIILKSIWFCITKHDFTQKMSLQKAPIIGMIDFCSFIRYMYTFNSDFSTIQWIRTFLLNISLYTLLFNVFHLRYTHRSCSDEADFKQCSDMQCETIIILHNKAWHIASLREIALWISDWKSDLRYGIW